MNFALEHVSYSYRTRHGKPASVFSDLNLHVGSRECIGIMGREGAGKSTLLQLIDGLLRPESGSVSVNGVDVGGGKLPVASLRRQIGFMFQFPEQQFFCATVEEELNYSLKIGGVSAPESAVRTDEVLRSVGLDPSSTLQRSPLTLSFGESRRLALALVLIVRPRLVLADEPTAGLDAAAASLAQKTLGALHAGGATIVLASHDVDFLAEIASRIIILADGVVAVDRPAAELLSDDTLLAQFGYEPPEVVSLLAEWKRRGLSAPPGFHRVEDLRRIGRTGW